MNYDHQIDNALNALHTEGRYRIFQDISRINGQYPKANWVKTDGTQAEITVWCGNDYLGMGQSPEVMSALKKVLIAQVLVPVELGTFQAILYFTKN